MQRTVEVPQIQYVEKVVDVPVLKEVQVLMTEVVEVTEIGADLPAESIAPIIVQSAASPPGPAQLVVNSHIPEPLPVMNSVAPTFVQEPAMLTYANPTTTTCGATTFVQEPAMQTYPNSTTTTYAAPTVVPEPFMTTFANPTLTTYAAPVVQEPVAASGNFAATTYAAPTVGREPLMTTYANTAATTYSQPMVQEPVVTTTHTSPATSQAVPTTTYAMVGQHR